MKAGPIGRISDCNVFTLLQEAVLTVDIKKHPAAPQSSQQFRKDVEIDEADLSIACLSIFTCLYGQSTKNTFMFSVFHV